MCETKSHKRKTSTPEIICFASAEAWKISEFATLNKQHIKGILMPS